MKKTAYLLAAVLAVGGISYCGVSYAANSSSSIGGQSNSMNGVKDTHSINSVREQLKEITEAAMSKNGLDGIADRLTVADQKRLGNLNKENGDQLNQLVQDINQKWQNKFGHKFNIKSTKLAFAEPFVVINSINEPQTAGAQIGSANNQAQQNHEVANVTIASSQGLPELNLTMLREHASWKLQVPQSMDAAQIKSNLRSQLQQVNQDFSKLPSDETQADRIVTHRVLMAITGAQGGNAQPAGAHNNM